MRHEDRKITGVNELVAALAEQAESGQLVWFRGQGDSGWKLSPSLARKKKLLEAEAALIKRFKQNAVPHLPNRPDSEWEWLFLMQHYRLPTRLLDWTESPLAALYFAVEESKHKKKEAALWCLDPVALNRAAGVSFKFAVEIPAFDHDQILDSYQPSVIAQGPASQGPLAAIAQRNSPRITAQMGTFTITHKEHHPIEDVGGSNHVWRLLIPPESKSQILDELATLRVTRLSLFPELDQVAATAMEVV